MIVTILGLPGQLTELCRDVCIEIARSAGREAVIVMAEATVADTDPLRRDLDTLGSLAAALIERPADHSIAVSTRPDRFFCQTLQAAARPFILVLDDPRLAALDLAVGSGMGAVAAARVLTTSCACLVEAVSAPTALKLGRASFGQEAPQTARALLALMSIEATDAAVAAALAILRRLAAQSVTPARDQDIRSLLRADLSPENALTIEAALTGFDSLFRGGRLGAIIATRETFLSVEPAGVPLAGQLDVTGRARCLSYGPYFSIPAGSWMLRLVLAFSIELADVPFTVDIIRTRRKTQAEAGRVTFQAIAGKFIAQLAFANPDPDAFLEFRFFVDRAVFDGRVSIGYAELARSDPHPEVDPNLSIEWQG